jgi:hypothetical protein
MTLSSLFNPLLSSRWSGLRRILILTVLSLGFLLGSGSQIWAQTPPVFPTPTAEPAPVAPAAPTPPPAGQVIPNPQQFRSLEQPDNKLSFQRAEELSAQANAALQAQNYDQATQLLTEIFAVYNQRSNYHQQLSKSFAGIQNQISESQREFARVAAELRDKATYDLAVVYRAAGKPEEAVGQLVQVISSQGPTRDLGKQAYQQLLEIGFVDTPFPG